MPEGQRGCGIRRMAVFLPWGKKTEGENCQKVMIAERHIGRSLRIKGRFCLCNRAIINVKGTLSHLIYYLLFIIYSLFFKNKSERTKKKEKRIKNKCFTIPPFFCRTTEKHLPLHKGGEGALVYGTGQLKMWCKGITPKCIGYPMQFMFA